MARRARSARSSWASATEPLARVRISYFERAGSEIATLDEARLIRSAFDLAANPPAWAAGQVVAELALLYCPPGQKVEASFRLVDRCLDCLFEGHDAAAVAWYAELWFLRLAGICPELDRCGVCGAELAPGPADLRSRREGLCLRQSPTCPRGGAILAAGVRWLQLASKLPLERVGEGAPEDAGGWLVALREGFTERQVQSWKYLRHLLELG